MESLTIPPAPAAGLSSERPVADLREDRLRPFEAGKADTQVSVP
jgi:hypothetical protein